MFSYIVRRLCYAIPILIGVNIITFALFFMVNSPDDIARMHLGNKHVSQAAIINWKNQHGYDKPLFYNAHEQGWHRLSQTLFIKKSLDLFLFNFGHSDQGRSIGQDIKERMIPSLALAIPVLIIGLGINISLSLLLALFRGSSIDTIGVGICVVMMSISGLFYVIIGQYIIGKLWQLVPISGYGNGFSAIKFLILPVLIGVIGGIGSSVRWYRTIFLEQLHKDYVRTARAKGLSQWRVLSRHVLRAGLIPILTGVVVIIPSLFMGSLIMESFFGIPGLGSYTIDAIHQQDFNVVRVMVFLGTVLYIIGLILTDISYTWADPRVEFN